MQVLLILKKFSMKLNIKWMYTIMRPPNIELKVKVLIRVWIIKRTPEKKKGYCTLTSTIAGSSRSLITRTLQDFFIIMVVSILLHCIFALLMPYAS